MSYTSTIGDRVYVGQEYALVIETGVDLTTHGGNVEVRYTRPDGTQGESDATITAAASGTISLSFVAGELAPAGVWLFQPALKDEDQPGPTFALSVLGDFDRTALPTAQEIRDYLEGYCITQSMLSDLRVARARDSVVRWIEEKTGKPAGSTAQFTEYISGTGSSVIWVSRRPVVSLDDVEYVAGPADADFTLHLSGLELVASEGMIKARYDQVDGGSWTFPKGRYNIKVTYTAGYATIPETLREAILALSAERVLMLVASQGGGGPSVSVGGYTRNYGNRGKYTDARRQLARWGHSNLSAHLSGVVAG